MSFKAGIHASDAQSAKAPQAGRWALSFGIEWRRIIGKPAV
jgi:hypothetical protein